MQISGALGHTNKVSGKKLATQTIQEMQKIGFKDSLKLADWQRQMTDIFPDVDKGISLTGVYTKSGETVFFKDNTQVGIISDSQFGKWFFDIWLGENTPQPKLRQQLLGIL